MRDEDPRDGEDQLEEHSLPGTNQAGKGPGACDDNDERQADIDEQHASSDEQRRRASVPHRGVAKSPQDA